MKKLDILIVLVTLINNSGIPKCEHPSRDLLTPFKVCGTK